MTARAAGWAALALLIACGHEGARSIDTSVAYDFRAEIVQAAGYAVVLDGDPGMTVVSGRFGSYASAVSAIHVPAIVTGPSGSRDNVLSPGYCAAIGGPLGTPTMEHVQLEAALDLTLTVYSAQCCGTSGCTTRTP